MSPASQTCFSCLCTGTSRRQLKTSLESQTVSRDAEAGGGKLQSAINMKEENNLQTQKHKYTSSSLVIYIKSV